MNDTKSIKIASDLHYRLKKEAVERKMTIKELATLAIEKELERGEEK